MLQELEPILWSDEKKYSFWQQALKVYLMYKEEMVI